MGADDNGEALFRYMNTPERKKEVRTYFVLEKASADYGRLREIGQVVSYGDLKYKILCLLCDKIISSQAGDYVFNRFGQLRYLYADIQQFQKFIFLQHGIMNNDLSGWLSRFNKNISLFVTASPREYESILQGKYYYDEKQVKLTGLPRYDELYDNAGGKVLTFMPTWRSYLVGGFNVQTDCYHLKNGFQDSSYCQMYRNVFQDGRLYEAAQKYGYEIRFVLHPSMPRECIEFLGFAENVKILGRGGEGTRYRELFAESDLLVTDYSSTAFDFAYLKKPVIYYQQDKEEFFSGRHSYVNGYFDYERDGFGEVEYRAGDLVQRITEYMENGCQLKERYKKRIEQTFAYHDKRNCQRVYDIIRQMGDGQNAGE